MAHTGFPISQRPSWSRNVNKVPPSQSRWAHGQGVLSLGDVETWLLDWTPEGSFCPFPPGKKMGKSAGPPPSTLKLGDTGGAAGPPGGGPSGRWELGVVVGMHRVGRPALRGRCRWEAMEGDRWNLIFQVAGNPPTPVPPLPRRPGISGSAASEQGAAEWVGRGQRTWTEGRAPDIWE